jgi:CRP-like cAMP-binding protein
MIFKEGEICKSTFMIREGEVRLLKEKSTLEAIAYENGQGKYVDTTLQCKRGFLSESFSKFQLGEAIAGQWIGDDFLVLVNSTTYSYTAIARSKVICLELQREEYDTIPKDILNQFRKHILDRRIWILDRMKNVTHFVDKLMKTTSTVDYSESLAEKKKKLPLATMSAIDAIRKKELCKGMITIQSVPNLLQVKEAYKTRIPSLKIKLTSKFRSLFRLGESVADENNDIGIYDDGQSQYNMYKYLSKCTPLSYASSTKPLNFMFPMISKDRSTKLGSKSPKNSPRHSSLIKLNSRRKS